MSGRANRSPLALQTLSLGQHDYETTRSLVMSVTRLCLYLILLIAALTIGAYLFAVASSAQTITEQKLRPDTRRIAFAAGQSVLDRSEEHTSELQSHLNLVCRLL